MKRIALFASGSGSNAEVLVQHFADQPDVAIPLILSNNPKAGVIDRARRGFGVDAPIPVVLFNRPGFYDSPQIADLLQQAQINLIVLAGFMWLVPPALVRAFTGRLVNIHPALLPKFGGKGMFGHHVHEAVVAAHETESGITIHYVNEQYDEGAVIFQARCPVTPTDTPNDVARKVQVLEHRHYPVIVEQLLRSQS